MGVMSTNAKTRKSGIGTNNVKSSTSTTSTTHKTTTTTAPGDDNIPVPLKSDEDRLLHLIQMYERAGGAIVRPEEDFADMLAGDDEAYDYDDYDDDDDIAQSTVSNASGELKTTKSSSSSLSITVEDCDDEIESDTIVTESSQITTNHSPPLQSSSSTKKRTDKSLTTNDNTNRQDDLFKSKGLLTKRDIEIYTKAQQYIVNENYLAAMQEYEILITESHPDIPIVLEYANLCELTEHEHMAIDLYEGILSFQPLHRLTLKHYVALLCSLSISLQDKKFIQRVLDLLTPILQVALQEFAISISKTNGAASSSTKTRLQERQQRLFEQVRKDFAKALQIKQGLDQLEADELRDKQEKGLRERWKSRDNKSGKVKKRKLGPIAAEWANAPSIASSSARSGNNASRRGMNTATTATGNDECPVCSKPATSSCSRCKSVSYCGRECQVKHWKDGHKTQCIPIAVNATITKAGEDTETIASGNNHGIHNRKQKKKKEASSSTGANVRTTAAGDDEDGSVETSTGSETGIAVEGEMDSRNGPNVIVKQQDDKKFGSANKLGNANMLEMTLYYVMIVVMATLFLYLMINSE